MPLPRKIIYVTREIERALGMPPGHDYLIAADRTPYGESIKGQYPDFITLIDSQSDKPLGTGDLLQNEKVRKLVLNNGGTVLVFKNTPRIEPIVIENGWTLLNPKAALGEKIENKLSQIEWLGELGPLYLPEHSLQVTKNIGWTGESFILQWGHGHTGSGTILVSSAADLAAIQARFPERMSRVSAYIKGPSFTVNAVVAGDKVMMSDISYQITGLAPFTDKAFTTIGNDWSVTKTLLTAEDIKAIESMTNKIGAKLMTSGWRGLFGVDVMRDEKAGRIFLIEINARQPASVTFESFLQEDSRRQGVVGLTTFEAHIKALLGEKIDQPLIPVKAGAQIVQRVTKTIVNMPDDVAGSLELSGYRVIAYPNSKENEDLIRVQSLDGIMEGDGKFNKRGEEILKTISNLPN